MGDPWLEGEGWGRIFLKENMKSSSMAGSKPSRAGIRGGDDDDVVPEGLLPGRSGEGVEEGPG